MMPNDTEEMNEIRYKLSEIKHLIIESTRAIFSATGDHDNASVNAYITMIEKYATRMAEKECGLK